MAEVGDNKHVHFILTRRASLLRFSKHIVIIVQFNGSYKETGNRTVCGFIFEVVSWPRFLNFFSPLSLFF